MTPKKWTLISKRDVSPHKWFPVEMRTYKLPNGKIIDDFSVTTIPDVSMVIPITRDGKIVLTRQFKPGIDEVVYEFPAGRIDGKHDSFLHLAISELEEETGIKADEKQLTGFAVLAGFTTKGTERVHYFLARDLEFNSHQKLDETEDIEVIVMTSKEIDEKILTGEIWTSQTIAGWHIAKGKFPKIFSK